MTRTAVIRFSSNEASQSASVSSSSRRTAVPPSVVDEHVDPAEPLDRRRDQAPGLARAGQVTGDVEVADAFRPAAGRHDQRALLAQLLRDAEADAGRRPGDDAYLAGEPEFHRLARLAGW